jgi:arginine:pyruvate transaminase
MFALIEIGATGMNDNDYAYSLLDAGVAVMPGTAFGPTLSGWVRLALTVDDETFARAVERIVDHAAHKGRKSA